MEDFVETPTVVLRKSLCHLHRNKLDTILDLIFLCLVPLGYAFVTYQTLVR
jgi:hypothetical protein